ncbi:MAG: guanylate kinase [Flavobacteriaceae bacterium]|nr:guanylate kinase [Flavobacteriaceae bacterium]
MKKIVILTAPSGSGKTSIAQFLEKHCDPKLSFSISATTRHPRKDEVDGEHYYFLSVAEFESRIQKELFLEYEKFYNGQYYGTLQSEIQRIWDANKHVLLDIEVDGAENIKKLYAKQSLILFIDTPHPETLIKRLKRRKTESSESLQSRIRRIDYEINKAKRIMDCSVMNIDLEKAQKEALILVENFLNH